MMNKNANNGGEKIQTMGDKNTNNGEQNTNNGGQKYKQW
jgi:hypothetical protein